MNDIYVVYLTIYSGNRLPPFYIGYANEKRVLKGYRGSVLSKIYRKIWELEKRKNPHLFKTIILQRFETDTEALAREEYLQRFFDVIKNPMYINMCIGHRKFGASQKGENHPFFGRHHSTETKQCMKNSHMGLAPWNRGVQLPEETKQKIKKATSGENNPMFGRRGEENPNFGRHHTDEAIQKMRSLKPIVVCPHCGKAGGKPAMNRHHFENCKFKHQ